MTTKVKTASTAKVTSNGDLQIHPPLESLKGQGSSTIRRNHTHKTGIPPALTAKQKRILGKCIDAPGRGRDLVQGAVVLQEFIVGIMPNGNERDVTAFVRLSKDGSIDHYSIILIDCNTRVYSCNGVCELAAMVDLIRKDHKRWLYDEFPEEWERQVKEHDGANLYIDHRKIIFGYNENAR